MTQTIDFRYELLFIACVLVSLISLIGVVALSVQRRHQVARRLLLALAIWWAAYLSIVFAVAASTKQRVIPMQQDLCFDEMCFAVVNVQKLPHLGPSPQQVRANTTFYVVTVRVTNHGRGRAQSEQGLRASLWSPQHTYNPSPEGQRAWDATYPQNAALTARVEAGQTVYSDQVFDLPMETTDVGLVLSNGFTPAYFVIGECPLFHKPTIMRLSQ